MAKKIKRSVSTGARTDAPVMMANGDRPVAATTRSTYQEFKPDYTPVVSDLKKIGILAVSFITILVALSFFLR